tara:strand:- start:6170 stop:6736 length:567 start_codon:yes stop_codon:yes gene_type:complete
MEKYHLDCAYAITKFKHHNEIKSNLLDLINLAKSQNVDDPGCETNISRADWHDAQNFKRDWTTFLFPYLTNPVLEMYNSLGYDGYTLHDIWFQQYYKNSGHGWHTHSANFTNVYYLELPESTPKTKIVSPYNQKDVIEIDVEEGDLLVFPSFTVHKGPPNISTERKTIISYNINATYSNNIYGQGINE